jgi:hypothetical protein
MLRDYSDQDLATGGPFEIGDALERGEIIRFPRSPIPCPRRRISRCCAMSCPGS